jgi:erythromycin esterase
MLQLPASAMRGKSLQLTGRVRVTDATLAAAVSLEAWGDRVVPAADSASLRKGSGWQAFRLRIAVPADESIHSFVIQLNLLGQGTAWFDDMALSVDGTVTTTLPASPPPDDAALRWLASRSARLRTTDPAARDASDLQHFDAMVGDARVVGLGESTHGTREFFQLKHRLLAHLVETKGFRLFAIEANQVAVRRANAWVLGGPGSVRDAMRGFFTVWVTEEVAALLEWMRAYNAAHPEALVQIAGYDMQDQLAPADSLGAFVGRRDPGYSPRVTQLTREYRAQRGYFTPQIADTTRLRWLAEADSLLGETVARGPRWLAEARTRADTTDVQWALQSAALYRQAAFLNSVAYNPARDSLMAENIHWLIEALHPGARAVVWAHDSHVSGGGDPQNSYNGGAQMGAVLRQLLGTDYRAFGLLTADGSYTATRSLSDFTLGRHAAFPATSASNEGILARLPVAPGFIGSLSDLRTSATIPAAAWAWQRRPTRSIGYAAVDYGFEQEVAIAREFDAVFLLRRTEASRPIP